MVYGVTLRGRDVFSIPENAEDVRRSEIALGRAGAHNRRCSYRDCLPAAADPKKKRAFRSAVSKPVSPFGMNLLPREQGERFRINLYDHGSGLAVGDYDNDGREDIYFLNEHGTNALYRNRGDGTFEDVTAKAGVALGDRVSVGATFADYDNDGYPDLFVTSTRGGNVLFHNRGNGTFEDVTAKAGVTHVGHSQTPVFFDYDNDGYLDLFVTNTARWTTDVFDFTGGNYEGKASLGDLMGSSVEYNILYHNNGNGTFTDVTASSGLRGRGWAGDVAIFDYNDDGYLDVFVPSMFGRGQLYRNNGHGTFTDVTAETLGKTPHGASGPRCSTTTAMGVWISSSSICTRTCGWVSMNATLLSRRPSRPSIAVFSRRLVRR